VSRPRLKLSGSLRPGLAAIALFVLMAATFLTASFPAAAGFGENAAITKSLGAALFSIDAAALVSGEATAVPAEGFLIAFEMIDVVLVAALVAAVMLARREVEGDSVTVAADATDDRDAEAAVAADGGERQ
jgi:NADH-quinone oxidoreductase subunit J